MRSKKVVLLLSLAFVVGCGKRPVPELPDDPEQVILFSVDGDHIRKRSAERLREQERVEQEANQPKGEALKSEPKVEAPKPDTLHGWPILGKVEVTGAERRKVVESTRDAIRRGPDQPARCFIPRHVVRIVNSGTTTDVVICFECNRFHLFRDGQRATDVERSTTVASDAQPYFDKLLTDAGIPIAPK